MLDTPWAHCPISVTKCRTISYYNRWSWTDVRLLASKCYLQIYFSLQSTFRMSKFSHLTPFCLALPLLCLPAGLRLPRCNCRKLTAWIQMGITCRAHYLFKFDMPNENWLLILVVLQHTACAKQECNQGKSIKSYPLHFPSMFRNCDLLLLVIYYQKSWKEIQNRTGFI